MSSHHRTNRSSYAFSPGRFDGHPNVNAIASFSFLDDRTVKDRGTWSVGLATPLCGPRWYGILESFGQRGNRCTRP